MLRFIPLLALMGVGAAFADCDKALIPELMFRLGGNNLQWPCQSTKNIYTNAGRYIPRNIIITRGQIFRDDAFLALPRYKPGVPFTLGRVSLKRGECFVSVAPYPCWSIQEEGMCDAMQNVVDVVVDKNEILWALDVGLVNTLEQPIRRCPPKVLAFNIKTGKLVKSIDLSSIVTAESRLQYLLVDFDPTGNAFLYIADAGTRSIVVHNVLLGTTVRVVLPGAVASATTTNDVLYTALVTKSCGTVVLYFTYLGSSRLFSIKADHLRLGNGSGAVVDVGEKPDGKEIVILGTDNGASLFVRYKGESDIYMWNTETCFTAANFLEVQHGGECRLATQVIPGHKRFMWALESNFHDFIANTAGCNGASIRLHPVAKECDDQ
ncbi:unnamed protein product [Hermetia illucens]|uniref:Bee-milk protein n=1 Tax=Hermetia illucens TaxID=343691 RepID=A0A7R8YUZ7_HERIL|nr:protein yellow [Hermetia illucens]CAD7083294.1 unnamed protein product [Hermetia illucens]